MSFGNGSHVLKRGFLRPNGGSRLPFFLILILAVGCTFLLYNVYTNSVNQTSLVEEIALVRKKWQMCQRDKTELETRFETHLQTSRSMKEELERLRTVERSATENQKELKTCKDQTFALQTENGEMKDKQKTEIESCQQKQKEIEDKLSVCEQAKSTAETEIEKLRILSSSAVQHETQTVPSTKKPVEFNEQPSSARIAEQQDPANVANGAFPAHRGAPVENENADQQVKRPVIDKLPIDGRIHQNGVGDVQAPKSGADASPTAKDAEHKSNIEKQSERPESRLQAKILNQDQVVTISPTVGVGHDVDANSKIQESPQILLDHNANVSRIADKKLPSNIDVGAGHQQPTTISVFKRIQKEKRRRLNKVIEASNPVDERPRPPVDPNNDRSRGELDDTQSETTTTSTVELKPAALKRMNFGDHDHQAEDSISQIDTHRQVHPIDETAQFTIDSRKGDPSHGIRGSLDQEPLPNPAIDKQLSAVTTADALVNHFQNEKASRVSTNDSPANAKLGAKKGLKDDYHYKDEDEEGDGTLVKPKIAGKPKKFDGLEKEVAKGDDLVQASKKKSEDVPMQRKEGGQKPEAADKGMELVDSSKFEIKNEDIQDDKDTYNLAGN